MSKDKMKEERLKILEMLSQGKITPEQAESLLAALNESGDATNETSALTPGKKTAFRMLKIQVDSADGDEVRIQLPIEFAKLLKNNKLNINGLDDMDIDVDALIQMINAGANGELVNVRSSDGDIVKIFVE
ncbi:MAG TPA: hypothetical protein PLH02_02505 [Bacillota bacterium]|nr:hypothetical protein [Bacillota bacterium]HPQ61739.1 hypothetical protein [Bacillota bacterium]HRX91274.1 hypothetical protein [Candidatus Izemoplasmatales bacterium]